MSTTYAAVSTATTTAATSMGAATSMDAATSMGDVDATIPVLDAALGAGAAFDMELTFHPADYTLFVLMMLMSALIGVYYGCYKRQDSVSEYLHGGKTMSVLPVAMSLISSNISGITMLAVPAEMYLYGTQFALLGIMVFPAVIVVMYWFLPMFFNLQCNSSFEYLEMRFDRRVRQLGSFLFALGQLLYMPVVIYVPCLALNQVSGISVHLISPIACLICIFYTTLGGVKAVIWTDALQLFLLVLASVAVIVLGVVRLGGLGVLLERSLEGGRIEFFNMDPNPYTRCTFWNVGVGACVTIILNMGAGPSSVQRFLSVPTLADARRTSVYLAFGYFLTKLFSVLTGLIIFASYFYCDPLDKSVGAVRKGDQLVPYFVMDVGRDYPGLSGLFVAGVFSAALSTMSGGLNTLSGTLYTDFIEKYLPKKVSDERASTHMKLVSLVIGAFCVGMIFVVENLGGVLQVAISFMGITAGAAYGLFFLGMFFPTVNSKGALVGAYTCLVVMVVTVGGNSLAMYNDSLKYPHLPTRTDGCLPNSTLDANFPTASPDAPSPHDADVFPLFKVSYLYFSVLGVAVTTVVALCVSACTGGNNLQTADPDLFSPAVARFLPRHRKNAKEAAAAAAAVTMKEYEAVPGADK
ncbi:sodium-coupled monocarboxylate transporter 1 [Frankliniella occidentalis]|uniref:Sodium-coupled monocarboxylate transporter 1 n=1 Tax=Frankliniella occidentalis TaxID=133901 RepID=A0A6J1STD8_FRAOC|nr:sodium-coupled monocarboxylate transporter 1 [Frankliniella occidentalis]